jgi:hypothetical protein
MFGPNDKCIYLYAVILTIMFIACLFTLGLQYLSYDKSYKITKFNYYNPDLTIQVIKDFDFKPNITIDHYNGNMSFLGLTGKIKLDCYSGLCEKYVKKICEREICHSESSEYFFNVFDKNKRRLSSCETYTYDCSFTDQTPEFKCSEECATKYSYYGSYCSSCSYKYDSEEGYCKKYNENNLYINDSVYCQPSNMIFFWKELYYENISYQYSYVNDAVLKNETCPEGKKPCGILDKYGNKLCIPKNEKCPINNISMGYEPPDKVHTYAPIKVGNKTIYYSNDFVEDGRIIKGLYSDSDVKIEYNENCSILDTYNLSYFLNENIKIYKDKYIPQSMKNNGKSYLKYCDFVVNNLDLNQLKNDYKLYQFSQKFNTDIYEKLKDKLSNGFFCSFFGCIYLLVYLFFSIWAMIYGKLNRSSLCCFWCFYNSNFDDNDIIDFIIFFIFLIPYNVLSILSTIWSSINLNDLNESNKYPNIQSNLFDSLFLYHKLFILGNIVIYSLIFVLFILSILVFFFKKTYNSNNINYTKLNDK